MATATNQNEPAKEAGKQAGTPLHEQIDQLRAAMIKMVRAGNSEAAIEALLEVITAQHHDISRLTKAQEAAVRARFARRSEKLTAEDMGQLALALGSTEANAACPEPLVPGPELEEEVSTGENEPGKKGPGGKPRKKGKHKGRGCLNPALPRRIIIHTVSAEERDCMHCGTKMDTIGHIDHERIDYIPARIEVLVDRREKVACRSCHQDITAAARVGSKPTATECHTSLGSDVPVETLPVENVNMPEASENSVSADDNGPLAPGAQVYRRVGPSFLAHLLEAKADDALPIYRQRQQLARLGFEVPLNTLYSYWEAASSIIAPVAQVVLSYVLGQDIVGVDDTRLDWLNPQARSRRRRGHLWCFVGSDRLVAFEFTETWCADDVAPWLRAIDGFIQCDDYAGYSTLYPDEGGGKTPLVPRDRRLGCWMHVRRPFHKAFKAGEKQAIIGLGHIKELYAIERAAREAGLGPAERLALRQRDSVPIAEEFFAWVGEQARIVRPASYLGKAIQYALGQQEFVMRCLTDGRFDLDTGRVERQIREPVIGRKNYLFSGSAAAAQRLAGVYTLVCSCQNLGINTRDYLIDIITQLQAGFPLRHINRLRPDVWAAERGIFTDQKVAQQPSQ